MSPRAVDDTLARWRHADAAWSDVDHGDVVATRTAAEAVVSAWMAYHEATTADATEVMLVADDDRRYVAVSAGSQRLLGYRPEQLLGQTTDTLSPEAPAAEHRAASFQRFLEQGRLAGSWPIRTAGGEVVVFDCDARAHHPVPGFHLVRIRRASEHR